MRLTRREALLGLLGATSVASLGVYDLARRPLAGDSAITEHDADTLFAVAEVVYPVSDPSITRSVVGYFERLSDSRRAAILSTISDLDEVSYRQFGAPFRSLDRAEGERLLEVLGVKRVQSRPEGTLPERVRFHLVNSVLYALLTNPRGTEPFGITNPVGYPGGFSSYTN